MFQRTLPILALVLLPAFAQAQDAKQPAQTPPTLVVRLASLDTLYDDLKLVGGMFGKDDPIKQIDDAIKAKLGPKGLFGIDGKRPIGFYARVGKDISDISGILMLPISTEKKFKEMLEAMDWKVTVDKEGIHTVQQDLLPMDVQYRIANKYAYVGILGQQDELLKPANLVAPEKIFTGKHKAAIALTLRIDQIPADARDAILKGIKEKFGGAGDPLPDAKKGAVDPQKLPKGFEDTVKKEIERIFTNVLTQGEELTVLVDIERKTKKLVVELSLSAKAESELAKDFKQLGQRTTLFAGVLHKDAAMNGLLSFEIPPGLRKAFDSLVKDAMAKVVADTKDDIKKKQAAKLLDALMPSLTSGEIDAAFSLRGPHKDKSFTVVGGFKLKEGYKLAGAVFELLKDLPESEQKLLKLNAATAGKVMIHRFDLQQMLGEAKAFVGDNPLYFAIRDDALFLAIGNDGLPAIQQAVTAAATATPPLQFDISFVRFAGIMDKSGGLGKKAEAMFKKGEDARVAVTLQGGSELRLRLTMDLSVLRLLVEKADPLPGAQSRSQLAIDRLPHLI
jgi:hypothetical protein